MLIMTKSDLEDLTAEDQRVTFEELKKKAEVGNFQGACQTSSKEWEDFNVHHAFNKTLITAFRSKTM